MTLCLGVGPGLLKKYSIIPTIKFIGVRRRRGVLKSQMKAGLLFFLLFSLILGLWVWSILWWGFEFGLGFHARIGLQ